MLSRTCRLVEYSERIEKILPQLDEMLAGLITLEKVRVILTSVRQIGDHNSRVPLRGAGYD